MDFPLLIAAFFTLFVVIDPIGLAPVFVAITQGVDAKLRFRIAVRSCLTAVGILTLFGMAGEALLEFVGISMAAFRISGGILLFATALDMLFERRTQRREEKSTEIINDPSIFPLAMPLIAGPGSMATIILLAGQPGLDISTMIGIYIVMILVIAAVFVLFLGAGLMERMLGDTGIMVVTRLLGMLLAALSVQFVLDGLRDLGVFA
ncbi:MAG: MarC family protein [Litoreibacter sp.]